MTDSPFDLEKILRDAERQMANEAETKARAADLLGHAESADGRVKVDWGSSGELTKLDIDPRALREGSAKLGETIVDVAREAKQDLERQMNELTREMFGAAGNPMDLQPDPAELKETIAGIQDLFTGGLRDANKIFDQMRRNLER